jgi:hypothetical protein
MDENWVKQTPFESIQAQNARLKAAYINEKFMEKLILGKFQILPRATAPLPRGSTHAATSS